MGYVRTGGYQVRDRHAAMAGLPSMDKTWTNFKSSTPTYTVIPADWEKHSELNWLSLTRQKVKYYPTRQFNAYGGHLIPLKWSITTLQPCSNNWLEQWLYINWAACCECLNKKIQLQSTPTNNSVLLLYICMHHRVFFSWGILTLCYRWLAFWI